VTLLFEVFGNKLYSTNGFDKHSLPTKMRSFSYSLKLTFGESTHAFTPS